MLMKRIDHSEREKEMLKKVGAEYELFRYKMLSKSVQEVYNACRCISFYECVYEYFQYFEKISTDFVNAANHSEAVLAELWEIYLKYEYLRIENWEEIEELLNVYVMERK